MNLFVSLLISFLLIFDYSFANVKCKEYKEYYEDHDRGWFYKEVCEKDTQKPEQKKKEKKAYKILTEKTLNIPWNKLDKLDPDEIQKLHDKARKIAVMYPTYHNVKEYQKLVNWITKKSETFMENWIKVSRTDTELARVYSEVPTSTAGRALYNQSKVSYINDVLRKFKDKAGLVVITREGCPYCERQKMILRLFAMETGWTYRTIDMSKVPNIVRKMGVARVPDIFLVVKGNNNKPIWIRIGTGLHTKNELKRLILLGLYNLKLIQPPEKSYVLW